jgi:hypothetical protein
MGCKPSAARAAGEDKAGKQQDIAEPAPVQARLLTRDYEVMEVIGK